MERVIEIQNLKNLKYLGFKLPEKPGVSILTAANGSGKTTLLTCLERISNSQAFPIGFKTSPSDRIDNFKDARITYKYENKRVVYSYAGMRWTAKPRSNSKILNNFSYNDSKFIKSSGERFYIQEKDLNTHQIRGASAWVKKHASEILENKKFEELRTVIIGETRGRGGRNRRRNNAFLLPIAGKKYYSEKNFSLGEVLVLNMLTLLENISQNSLILIDEIELALHPKVQLNVFEFLNRLSKEKDLTIIISTHSSSLIRVSKNIIFLENEDGIGSVKYNCTSAYALQGITIKEDIEPDIIFLVEDSKARNLLDALYKIYIKSFYTETFQPMVRFIPVGGFKETVRLLVNIDNTIINNSKLICFLDKDVENDIIDLKNKTNLSDSQHNLLKLFNDNHNR
ncbi:MAG: AAA family ATPase, partial [Cyclobacteriaceae bacterium]